MKLFLIPITAFILLAFNGCDKGGSYSTGSFDSGKVDYSRTEEEIKVDLKTREQNSPTSYLKSDGTYRKNLFGEMVLEGTISNSATLASYKDAKLHITGYSKTKSKIGTWEETIYEVIRPGRSKGFKIKLMLPKSVKSVGWEVYSAIPLR